MWVCGLGWHCDFIFTGMVNKTDSDTNDETGMYLGRRNEIDKDCVRDTTSMCGSIIIFELLSFAGHQIHHRGETTQPTHMLCRSWCVSVRQLQQRRRQGRGRQTTAMTTTTAMMATTTTPTATAGKKQRRRTVVCCGTKSSIDLTVTGAIIHCRRVRKRGYCIPLVE